MPLKPPTPTYTLPDGQVLEIPAELMLELDQLDSTVDTLAIKGDAEVNELNAVGKRALELWKLLDKERAASKAPYSTIADGVDTWARPFLQRMKTTQERAKNKLAQYAADLQRQRAEMLEAQRKAEQAAAQVAPPPGRVVSPLLPTAPLPEVPTSIPLRTEYDVRYIDPDKIPRKYLIPDYDAILADLKAGHPVEGCELVTMKKVVTGR